AVATAAATPPPPPAPSQAELQAQAEAQLRARDAKVKALDDAVAAKEKEIADKEKALGDYEGGLEQNLVDIESKKSEMLLGRIYLAIRQTATENGVSVVIDKSAILYGQPSVDLTQKVLKKLEETQP
ncbi:MAG: OmpH family outer membrane protein, partial [Elusimicrobia bacterium]|nr:OmpH family outer membrane protein [Elusimicrobiota bacterium]